MISWECLIWICVIISYFCILIFLWNLACFVRFTRWCFSCFSLRLGRDDVNDIVMQESMHFLFKLQSISLEKHLNGFAVVHLLSVRPTSVRDHRLWDDERGREGERERERERDFYLPPYQHTSHAPPLLTVTGENLSGLCLLLRASRVCVYRLHSGFHV